LSSIRITCPSKTILLLFINLTVCFLLVRSVRNSFWFSRIHIHFALGQRFFSMFYAQMFWDVVRLDLSVSKLHIRRSHQNPINFNFSVGLNSLTDVIYQITEYQWQQNAHHIHQGCRNLSKR
jgi:hypothetical protein